MNSVKSRLFVGLQYLLPRYVVTALVYRLARVSHKGMKNALIRGFVRLFKVDIQELDRPVPDGYACFNDFFTRELSDGARCISTAKDALVSPVDGTVSEAGAISSGQLLQAKGRHYLLKDLLATDFADAAHYDNGRFVTIYLAPHNYHRVHAPLDGNLVAARYVPGDLFSVNHATVTRISDLFARNERLVFHFESSSGPFVVIFVGALNVGSISTPWTGELRPEQKGMVRQLDLQKSETSRQLQKGDLLGWFNMGSTVILLLPGDACELRDDLAQGTPLRVGEKIATVASSHQRR